MLSFLAAAAAALSPQIRTSPNFTNCDAAKQNKTVKFPSPKHFLNRKTKADLITTDLPELGSCKMPKKESRDRGSRSPTPTASPHRRRKARPLAPSDFIWRSEEEAAAVNVAHEIYQGFLSKRGDALPSLDELWEGFNHPQCPSLNPLLGAVIAGKFVKDAMAANANGPINRQGPAPVNAQQGNGNVNGNGMNANGYNAVPPFNASHQMDMNFIHDKLKELSDVYRNHQVKSQGVIKGVEQIAVSLFRYTSLSTYSQLVTDSQSQAKAAADGTDPSLSEANEALHSTFPLPPIQPLIIPFPTTYRSQPPNFPPSPYPSALSNTNPPSSSANNKPTAPYSHNTKKPSAPSPPWYATSAPTSPKPAPTSHATTTGSSKRKRTSTSPPASSATSGWGSS